MGVAPFRPISVRGPQELVAAVAQAVRVGAAHLPPLRLDLHVGGRRERHLDLQPVQRPAVERHRHAPQPTRAARQGKHGATLSPSATALFPRPVPLARLQWTARHAAPSTRRGVAPKRPRAEVQSMPEPTPPRPASDRNLLFGILALQMDFIGREQLIAAMSAWVLDKAKPLGETLQGQGALSEADRATLDALVERHLARHGGDPERSLASVGPAGAVGSVREELGRLADPDL